MIQGGGQLLEIKNGQLLCREDLTQEEAEDVLKNALGLAMARDGSSGGIIRTVVCSKDKSVRKAILDNKVAQLWDE